MDTRTKIVTAQHALALAKGLRESARPFHVVTGFFDVLQPEMVQRLQQRASAGSRLFAVVLNPPEALLADRARAELAASLRVIDYVIPSAGEPSDLVHDMQPDTWIREETAHQDSAERLIEHVFERHGLERERRPGH